MYIHIGAFIDREKNTKIYLPVKRPLYKKKREERLVGMSHNKYYVCLIKN